MDYKFYRTQYELIYRFNVGLNTLLREGLSEPELYGGLVYKLSYKKECCFFFLFCSENSLHVTDE